MASSVSNTSAAAYAREIFTPSKGWRSLVVQTENKSFRASLGLGYVLLFWFLFYNIIAQRMCRFSGSKFVLILGCNTSLYSPRSNS